MHNLPLRKTRINIFRRIYWENFYKRRSFWPIFWELTGRTSVRKTTILIIFYVFTQSAQKNLQDNTSNLASNSSFHIPSNYS